MKTELTGDVKWIRDHHFELQQKYPDMYVAIYDGRVIAADKEFGKVYEKVERLKVDAIIKYIFSGDLIVL